MKSLIITFILFLIFSVALSDEIEECCDKDITNAIEGVMAKNKFSHSNIAIEINGTCNNCLNEK